MPLVQRHPTPFCVSQGFSRGAKSPRFPSLIFQHFRFPRGLFLPSESALRQLATQNPDIGVFLHSFPKPLFADAPFSTNATCFEELPLSLPLRREKTSPPTFPPPSPPNPPLFPTPIPAVNLVPVHSPPPPFIYTTIPALFCQTGSNPSAGYSPPLSLFFNPLLRVLSVWFPK